VQRLAGLRRPVTAVLPQSISITGKLLGGWQVTGIDQFQTGTTCGVASGNDFAGVGQDGSFYSGRRYREYGISGLNSHRFRFRFGIECDIVIDIHLKAYSCYWDYGETSMKDDAVRLLQVGIAIVTFVVPALAGLSTPEPATVLLMGGGLAALILIARRKRARK
jgi:hypothetical protein